MLIHLSFIITLFKLCLSSAFAYVPLQLLPHVFFAIPKSLTFTFSTVVFPPIYYLGHLQSDFCPITPPTFIKITSKENTNTFEAYFLRWSFILIDFSYVLTIWISPSLKFPLLFHSWHPPVLISFFTFWLFFLSFLCQIFLYLSSTYWVS